MRSTTVTIVLIAVIVAIASCNKQQRRITCQNGGAPYQYDSTYKRLNIDSCTCLSGYMGTYCEKEKRTEHYGIYEGTIFAPSGQYDGEILINKGQEKVLNSLYLYIVSDSGNLYITEAFFNKDLELDYYSKTDSVQIELTGSIEYYPQIGKTELTFNHRVYDLIPPGKTTHIGFKGYKVK